MSAIKEFSKKSVLVDSPSFCYCHPLGIYTTCSLCIHCPGICYVDQADLKLIESHVHAGTKDLYDHIKFKSS